MSVAARVLGSGAVGSFAVQESRLRAVVLASGLVVLTVGLAAVLAWHAQVNDLTAPDTMLAPLPYNSALAFGACGAALVLALFRRVRIARLAVGLVALLAAAALVRYLLDWQAGIGGMLFPAILEENAYAFHMAPVTAFGFLLAAAALWQVSSPTPGPRHAAAAGLLATVVFALGAVPVIGYVGNVTAAFVWRDLTLMSGLAALAFTVLAPGMFAAAILRDPERSELGLRWMPVAVATGLSVLSVILWLSLKVEHREGLEHTIRAEAQAAAHDVRTALERRAEALQRMARRWEVRGGTPRDEWMDDARQYLRDLKGGRAIAWSDAQGRLQWLMPQDSEHRASLSAHVADLDRVVQVPRRAVLTTGSGEGVTTFTLHVPLIIGGERQGAVSVLHDAGAFFDGVLESRMLRNLQIAVRDRDGGTLYRSGGDIVPIAPFGGHEMTAAGITWEFIARPRPAFLAERDTWLPLIVLLAGILLAGLVAACIRLLQIAEWRKTSLARLNENLEARIAERTGELERAQQDLVKSYDTERVGRRRLRWLLDSLAEAIYSVDTDGNCVYCNAACQRLLGYRRDQIIGRNMHDLIHHTRPDGTPYPREECTVYRSIFEGDGAHVEDELLWRADGSSFLAEYWSLPLRDDDGKLMAGVVTFFDVSERRQAQESLEQRYRQQAAVSELGLAALRGGTGDLMQQAAETAARTLDVEFAKVLELQPPGAHLRLVAGVGWRDGLVGDVLVEAGLHSQAGYTLSVNQPVVVTDLAQETRFVAPPLMQSHGVVSGMSTIIHGREGPWGVLGVHSARPRHFDQADLAFLQSVANLIGYTLQGIQAADEIRMLNEELENRVQQRTGELEAANRELEGFSYSVSHDLRSPLRAIDGFADMLLEDHAERLDEEGRRVLGVIQRNVAKMGRLIDELLQFSRLSRRELTRKTVDMRALVEEVLEETREAAPGREFDIQVESLPDAEADPVLLRQVWTNLIGNAVKYTRGRDPARIRVRGERRETDLIYCVEDNGVGFDMNYADKLFGVFQRLHRESEFEGTGVGLALVQRIVARHGGEIRGEGEPDVGATFTFTLPREYRHE